MEFFSTLLCLLCFTLYLDVLEQHRFDHLPSHQDASGSPIQDVCTGLQTHLKTEKADMHPVKHTRTTTLSLLTQAGPDTHCVGVPFSVVSDFNPLLVISLGHFLTLLVLDLNTC